MVTQGLRDPGVRRRSSSGSPRRAADARVRERASGGGSRQGHGKRDRGERTVRKGPGHELRQPVKLAFLVFAACTCAWVKAPVAPPPPAPAPPPPCDPRPDVPDGEAQGSLEGDALDEAVGSADVVVLAEALGVAVVVGVTEALGEAASGLALPNVMP